MRGCNIHLRGPIIRAKAKEFTEKINEFKATAGWFEGFKDRNDVTFQTVCGKNASEALEEATGCEVESTIV